VNADLEAEGPAVLVARGNFYLSRETCDRYFPGIVSVALLARDDAVWIVPLAGQSAGGLILKQRNARGDRVIHAQEFFRNNGMLEEFDMRTMPVQWSAEAAALIVGGFTKAGSIR
jgi:hypothetical protein